MSFAPIVKKVAPAVVNVYAAQVSEPHSAVRRSVLPALLRRATFGGRASGAALARLGRDRRPVRPRCHQYPRDRGRRPGQGLAGRQARVRGRYRAQGPARRSRGARSRRAEPSRLEFGDSDDVQVGDLVLAIGNPFGVGQTVTHGIVSALARTQVGISDYQFFIQTDAAINPGNSGGALVDMDGQLVGINTAIFSRSGGSQGIGFAIPANMVRVVVDSARRRRQRGQPAVARRQAAGGDAEIAEGFGLKRPAGALVARSRRTARRREPGSRRRRDRRGRRPGGRRSECLRLPLRDAALGGNGGARRAARRARKKIAVALETAPELPRDEIADRAPLAVLRGEGRQPFAGAGRRAAARSAKPRRRGRRRCQGSPAGNLASTRRHLLSVNGRRSRRPRPRRLRSRRRLWRFTLQRDGQRSAMFSG